VLLFVPGCRLMDQRNQRLALHPCKIQRVLQCCLIQIRDGVQELPMDSVKIFQDSS
jgi:hypothetical protein